MVRKFAILFEPSVSPQGKGMEVNTTIHTFPLFYLETPINGFIIKLVI